MSIAPPFLKKGDTVAIICPAKKLPYPMDDAVDLLQSWGLNVILGESVNASWNQFGGDDELRASDLQKFIDDNNIKAIFAARGGYGTVRIIDRVNFGKLRTNPKWVIGFSDITVLHAHLYTNYQLQSIHGQMPINIPDASIQSLQTLRKALFGEELQYDFATAAQNRPGRATAELIGGNLSLLVNILGSVSDFNYDGKILFLEDVSEYLYSIDRMLYTLKRASKLEKLAGLIVGGFTEIKDNDIPFGFTIDELILNVVKEYDFPVAFDFPAGHVANNNSLILGKEVTLIAEAQGAQLIF